MDVQDYISSGILESYVLGCCSQQEVDEVESLMVEHTAIRDEILVIQDTLELAAFGSPLAPAAAMKSRIWESIQEEKVPVIPMNRQVNETPVFSEPIQISNSNGRTWLAYAASFALIFGTASVAIFFYTQNRRIENQLATVEKNNQLLQKQMDSSRNSLGQMESKLNMIALADTKKVNLSGVPALKDSKAVVFWNQDKKQVILTGLELPSAPSDKQYQLWALVDGVPVDAGVFDSSVSGNSLIEMKSIDKSQAFAITLEPKGGSASPHLDALCVIGNV